jgi:hypothetical protein
MRAYRDPMQRVCEPYRNNKNKKENKNQNKIENEKETEKKKKKQTEMKNAELEPEWLCASQAPSEAKISEGVPA